MTSRQQDNKGQMNIQSKEVSNLGHLLIQRIENYTKQKLSGYISLIYSLDILFYILFDILYRVGTLVIVVGTLDCCSWYTFERSWYT